MQTTTRNARRGERGFTLVEALVAMLILTFGLIAITNLFIVASSLNSVANHSTAAAAQAAGVMERLKSVDFNDLVTSPDDSLDNDYGTTDCDPAVDTDACLGAGNYNLRQSVDGVGFIKVRWRITDPNSAGFRTLFIAVRAWSEAPLAGARSRAEFTTFRSCTLPGCPGIPIL